MQPHIYCMYMKSTTERNRFSRDAQPTRKVINDEKGRGVLSQQWQIEMNKSK